MSNMTFGNRLLKALEYRGKTQSDVSKNCGISKSNLSKYIQGKLPPPKQETIISISKYLRIAPSFLMGLDNQMIINTAKPTNTLGHKSIRQELIDEITSNLTWLDIPTLRMLNKIIGSLSEGRY